VRRPADIPESRISGKILDSAVQGLFSLSIIA
jgi:hypothetical protein